MKFIRLLDVNATTFRKKKDKKKKAFNTLKLLKEKV